MTIVKHCPACGKKSSVSVPEAGYIAWQAGLIYAREIPGLTPAQIDTLLTGWHPECVERLETASFSESIWPADVFIEG